MLTRYFLCHLAQFVFEKVIKECERHKEKNCLFDHTFCSFSLEIFTFLRSVRKVFLKTTNDHQKRRDSARTKRQLALDFLFVFSMETCHVVGLAILVFVALPNVDTPHALVLTNCFALIPSLLLIDSDIRSCQ